MDNSNNAFRDFEQAGWEDGATAAAYDAHFAGLTAQSLDALLEDAGVRADTYVLDVGTGAGYVAAAAFRRGADAVGIDFSATQVRMARAKHPGVRFEQADAEQLPYATNSFDAVVNAFGICHLPQPEIALREAWRVLKPGGRIAFTVWDVPDRAVAFGAFYAAVRTHGSMDVGLPAGPNFFLFSDPQQCTKALLTAGFEQPRVRQVAQVWRLSDADQLFETFAGGTVRAAATLRAQSPQAKEAVRTALVETVSQYKLGDQFEMPMPAVLASAVKPLG